MKQVDGTMRLVKKKVMEEPLLWDDDNDNGLSCCWRWRRRHHRRQPVPQARFEVLRRLAELKAVLRAKVRINMQHASAAIEEAKQARREGRTDDAVLHMRRAHAFQAVNRQHSQILINLEVRQVQVENDPSAVADALVQINALPAAPRKTVIVESPSPKTKNDNVPLLLV